MDVTSCKRLGSSHDGRLRITTRQHITNLGSVSFAVALNTFQKLHDIREIVAEGRQITCRFRGAALLFFEFGSQVKPAVRFFWRHGSE